MHNDDLEGELFEGRLEVSALENGESFNLSGQTYFRLANFAMTAAGVGIQPALISRLPGGGAGCRVIFFGQKHEFDVALRVLRSGVTISISAQPLDGPLHCIIPVFSGQDDDAEWSRALRLMCEFESIGYYDSFWAGEQQDDGGDGVETA